MRQKPGYLFVLPWELGRPGGVDQVVLNLYRRWNEDATMRPVIMLASWAAREPSETEENGRRLCRFRLRSPYSKSSGWLGFAKGFFPLLKEIGKLRRYLADTRTRTVNIHYPSLSALQFVFIKRWFDPGLKIVLSFHGMDLTTAKEAQGFERRLWSLLATSADQLVGCSQALADAIADFLPEAADRTIAIHNGLDVEWMLSCRDLSFKLPPHLTTRPFILSVAAFERKKGLDVLIRAFKRVHPSQPELALVLAGVERGAGPELRTLAEELGLSKHVFFMTDVPHDRLHAYYTAAHLFCLPSRSEPFGIVLLEAGAFGCAVVATRTGGIPEIIEDGVSGKLVAVEDEAGLAVALEQLMQTPDDRARFGKALQERVERRFSWARAFQDYRVLSE